MRGGEIDKIDDNSWPAGYSIDDTVVVVPVFFILLLEDSPTSMGGSILYGLCMYVVF